MRTIRVIPMAFAIWILLAIPALAQRQETITQTFRLTIYGEAPEGVSFAVTYNPLPTKSGGDPRLPNTNLLVFCGQSTDVSCQGGGTTYTESVELSSEYESVQFGYSIVAPGDRLQTGAGFDEERDASGERQLGETVIAYYNFDVERGALGSDPQDMPELPNTGAGSMAGGPPLASRP